MVSRANVREDAGETQEGGYYETKICFGCVYLFGHVFNDAFTDGVSQ